MVTTFYTLVGILSILFSGVALDIITCRPPSPLEKAYSYLLLQGIAKSDCRSRLTRSAVLLRSFRYAKLRLRWRFAQDDTVSAYERYTIVLYLNRKPSVAQQPSDGFLPYKGQAPSTKQKIGVGTKTYPYSQISGSFFATFFSKKVGKPHPSTNHYPLITS